MKQQMGYYEINRLSGERNPLPVHVLAGNVIYNGLHWHDHTEIMACIHGGCSIRVEGEVLHLGEGEFLTINGGDRHEIFDGTPGGLQIICSINQSVLQKREDEVFACRTAAKRNGEKQRTLTSEDAHGSSMDPDRLDSKNLDAVKIWEALGEMAYLTVLEPEEYQGRRTAQKQNEKQERAFWGEHLLEGESWYRYHMYAYQLLLHLHPYRKKFFRKNAGKKDTEFQECIQYIHEHYGESLGAAILAERMRVSEPTIYRMFQKQLGMSPVTYIQLVRVNVAALILKSKKVKVTEIAFACGFTSLSNFYRIFQETMHMTPGEYRKEMQNQDISPMQFGYTEQSIMHLNEFQNFYQLEYSRDALKKG